jgi:asparagine synthase (glutamine-hydrolysing)
MLPAGFLIDVNDRRATCSEIRTAFGRTNLHPIMGLANNEHSAVILLGSICSADCTSMYSNASAEQMLRMYDNNGIGAVLTANGDFAVVIIDRRRRRIIACRDRMGGYPLFWRKVGASLFFANSLRPLAGICGVEIDREYLADFLALPNCGVAECQTERTALRECQRVLPGQALEFVWGDQNPYIHRVPWEIFPKASAMASETVRRSVDQAVCERLTGNVGCHFSGGIDSTAVAMIAARQLESGTVQAFSHVYDDFPHLRREREYISYAARFANGLVLNEMPQAADGYYRGIEELPPFDEPHPGLATAWRTFQDCKRISETGVTTLLTGVGGDHIFDTCASLVFLDMLLNGRIIALKRLMTQLSRRLDCGPFEQLSPIFNWLLPPIARSGLRTVFRRGRVDWMSQTDFTIPPWIRDSFARHHHLFERSRNNQFCIEGRGGLDLAARWNIHRLRSQSGDFTRWYAALPRGMYWRHPLLDWRVIQSALQCPMEQRWDPGRQKPLLTLALSDVLPMEIVQRKTKGHFGEVVDYGLTRNVLAVVKRIPRTELANELIDFEKLLECAQMASMGVYRDVRAIDRLNLSISLAHWLGCYERWCSETFFESRRLVATHTSIALTQQDTLKC